MLSLLSVDVTLHKMFLIFNIILVICYDYKTVELYLWDLFCSKITNADNGKGSHEGSFNCENSSFGENDLCKMNYEWVGAGINHTHQISSIHSAKKQCFTNLCFLLV